MICAAGTEQGTMTGHVDAMNKILFAIKWSKYIDAQEWTYITVTKYLNTIWAVFKYLAGIWVFK